MLAYKVLCDPTSVCLTPIMSHVPLIYSAPATLALCYWKLPSSFLSTTYAGTIPSVYKFPISDFGVAFSFLSLSL